MAWWAWLIVGLFVGATLGLVTGGLCSAAALAEREQWPPEQWWL